MNAPDHFSILAWAPWAVNETFAFRALAHPYEGRDAMVSPGAKTPSPHRLSALRAENSGG